MNKFPFESDLFDSEEVYTYDEDGNVIQIRKSMLGKIKTTTIEWEAGEPVSRTVTITDV